MWFSFVIPALVALAWIVLPGLVVVLGLRLRTDAALLFAPLVSVAVIAISAIIAPKVGLSWGPLPPLLLTALVAAGVWAVRIAVSRRRRRHESESTHPRRAHHVPWGRRLTTVYAQTFIALGVGMVLMTVVTAALLGSPHGFSQTYDAVYHLNSVRWILDHGTASSFDLSAMIAEPTKTYFYPAAWHGIASLVLTTIGSDDVRFGTNAMVLVTLAYVWPASVLAFVRTWTPGPIARFALIPAVIFSAAMTSFPYAFISFGVLYPNLLGYALVPGYLALFGALLGLRRRMNLSWPAILFLGFVGALGVALAHPSGAMAVMVAAIALTAGYAVSVAARRHWAWVLGYLAAAGALYGIAAAVWPIIRPKGEAANSWAPTMNPAEAVGQALFMSPFWTDPQWALMFALLLGFTAALRYREYGTLLAWVSFVFLWTVAASWADSPERTGFVGPWFSDPNRLAALLPLAAVPLCAMGAGFAISRIQALIRDFPALRRKGWAAPRGWAAAAVILPMAVLLLVLTQTSPRMVGYHEHVARGYKVADGANVISAREMELIDEIPDVVPSDALIYTYPWHGEALVYGFTGIETTSQHQQDTSNPDEDYLDEHLNQIDSDPKVCETINKMGVDYAVVFFGPTINEAQFEAPGTDGLTKVKGLTLVKQEGGAYLYKVTGC